MLSSRPACVAVYSNSYRPVFPEAPWRHGIITKALEPLPPCTRRAGMQHLHFRGDGGRHLVEPRVYKLGSSSGKAPPAAPASLPEIDTSPESCHWCSPALGCGMLAAWPSGLKRRLNRPPVKCYYELVLHYLGGSTTKCKLGMHVYRALYAGVGHLGWGALSCHRRGVVPSFAWRT